MFFVIQKFFIYLVTQNLNLFDMKSFIRFIFISLFSLAFLFLFQKSVSAQVKGNSWQIAWSPRKAFIENKGQFSLYKSKEKVLFAYDNGPTMIYFTKKGVRYSFLKRWSDPETDNERVKASKTKFSTEEWEERDEEKHNMKYETDVVSYDWLSASTNVQISGEEETSDYHSYPVKQKDGSEIDVNNIKGYNKIIYKNIYPKIDVEFEFHPIEGIKYSVILHPGANISKYKMNYSRDINIDNQGNVIISTKFGDITDHAPSSFYGGNKDNPIKSGFVQENNIISFKIEGYDNTQEVTIDPWVQTPIISNSNGVWECERDATGNVYIIGGDMPMKLIKYNAGGTIQWTHNTPWDTANYWLGTFATDLQGNSFVTAGSVANLQKISTTNTILWSNSAPAFSSDEYWNIAFNCDQTKLIIGGTQGTMTFLQGAIFDINTSNGAINSFVPVGYGNMVGIPPSINECRSITSSRNARYYFLTLDTIGCLDQEFNICPSASPTVFRENSTYNLAYKCENYRPNNGNAGIMAIRANRYFVYTQNGTQIQKRSLADGSVITSAAIPGGISTSTMGQNQVGNSGIDIDTCGNVYVGSGDRICEFDADLNLITSVNTPYKVSDVAVSTGGNVIVCGTTGTSSNTNRTGYVQSLNMSACNPMSLFCCNANVCPAGPLCSTDAPIQLVAETPGGIWSGPGVDANSGIFDPAAAGAGLQNIVYTLPCGSDSINILVNQCLTLVPCVQLDGDIAVSGGIAPYTWQEWTPAGNTQITTQAECTSCGYTWLFGQCMNGVIPVTTCNSPAHWTTIATADSIPPPFNFPLQVTDANNNAATINDLASLPACSNCPTLTIIPSNISGVLCAGGTDGSFDVTTSGGVSPYDYVLMNGATTVATFNDVAGSQSFTGLAPGTYTLNVADNDTCPGTLSVTITEPTALDAGLPTVVDASCGQSDGSITVSPSGGTGGYGYIWNTTPQQNTATATGLPAAAYIVTITDANGCTITSTITVNNIGGPTVTATSINASCGQSNGSATVIATGGTGNYTYSWDTNPVQTTATATGLAAGTYTVSVNDGTCTATALVIVDDVSTGISLTISNIVADSCTNGVGGATANVTGGTTPYTYSWNSNPAQTTSVLHNVHGGTYIVTVADATGCATSDTVVIPSTPGLNTLTNSNAEMCGQHNGDATVITSGGTGVYTYIWNNAQTTGTISGLSAGNYSVTVSDGTCTATTSVTVGNLPGPTAGFNSSASIVTPLDGPVSFYDNSTGNISSWVWNYGDGTTNGIGSSTSHQYATLGTYVVTLIVTDFNNCTDTVTGIIKVVDNFTFYIPNSFTPDEDVLNDGFTPKGLNVDPNNFEMFIFDRWGDLIYQTNEWDVTTVKHPWNGTKYNKGKIDDIIVGVYVYRINVKQLDGNKFVYIGDVTIIK